MNTEMNITNGGLHANGVSCKLPVGREVTKPHKEDGKVVDESPINPSPVKNMVGLQEQMLELHDAVKQIQNRLWNMASTVSVHQMQEKPIDASNNLFDKSNIYCDKRKSSKQGVLADKEFMERNSLLTDLFEIAHIRTIYNIFIVILIWLLMTTVAHDIMTTGTTFIGFSSIINGFGKLSTTFEIWCMMKGTTLATYLLFNLWAHRRLKMFPKTLALHVWDYGWLVAFILYQIVFIVLPARAVLIADLPIASSAIVMMEQVRMLMKAHAFVRSTAPRFLSYKPHTERAKPTGPGFSQFLYFMFAPTLVYRDSYPRTKEIRWKIVVWNYLEVALVIFYIAFIFERFLIPVFKEFGTHPLEAGSLVRAIFGSMMPGILFFLCGFYCLLHSWMNGSAELLRFADRLFYKDWWTSSSYRRYYRTWNVVVHDWLYTYIYKDMYEIVTPGNRILSTCAVFTISALFHEYILAFIFRFFYPVMLLMFGGFGLVLLFLPNRVGGNLFMWLTLCIGNGTIMTLYVTEFYARRNCPSYYDGVLDLFLPRSWSCNAHTTS